MTADPETPRRLSAWLADLLLEMAAVWTPVLLDRPCGADPEPGAEPDPDA